ncbi:MAG: SRPBCC domain-containing protein [Chitinophagaceae bacterium]
MNSTDDLNSKSVITSSRLLSFPVHIVYEAWTNPGHLSKWWGPKDFTNTFNTFDLRPGGKWSFIMHSPEGGNFINECEFTNIQRNSLLAWKRFSQPLFCIEVHFQEISANETNIIFNMIFDDPDLYKKILAFTPEKNEENFDRLEAELAKVTENNDQRINHSSV